MTSCYQFHNSIFHIIRDELYDFVRYFIHFQTLYRPNLWNQIIGLLEVNPCRGNIFPPRFDFFEDVLAYELLVICFSYLAVASCLFFQK